TGSTAWRVLPLISSRIPSLASAAPAMAPEGLGTAGSVCVSERAASTAALSFSGVETSGTGPPSFTTTPTPTPASATRLIGTRSPASSSLSIAGTKRMTASNVFSASSLSNSNGGRILKVTLWPVCFSNSVAMAFAAIRVDPTLSTRTSAALARVDEPMSVSTLTAMGRKNRRIVSSGNDDMVHCVRIYTRKPSATRSPLRGVLHLSGDQSPPARKDPAGGKLSGRGQVATTRAYDASGLLRVKSLYVGSRDRDAPLAQLDRALD